MTVNYETLLTKYMQHVIDSEGISYIEHLRPGVKEPGGSVAFTQDEIAALSDAEKRARAASY